MKLSLKVLLLILIISQIAAIVPPQLPSSFFGVVVGASDGMLVANNICSVCQTRTKLYAGQVVYSIDIVGGQEGQTVIFYVDNQFAGSASYKTGVNQYINLVYRGRKSQNQKKTFRTHYE